MITKGKHVVGLKIITIDTGSVIEHVDDIAYNPSTQRVEALLVSSGGIFSSAKAIHMDDVNNIGEDAVIVKDASVIKSVKDIGESVRSISDSNKHLVKTNVLTVDGKELGKVTDLFFDSETGAVDSMEVSQGGLKNMREGKKLIKPSDVVTIGADATIVSAYIEAVFEEQAEDGGINGAFNSAKDKAAELTTSVKDTSREAAEAVKEKSTEFKNVVQDKTSDTQEVIKDKSSDAKDTLDDKSRDTKIKAKQLSEEALNKVDELAIKADENTQELRADTRNKATQAKDRIEELTDKANEKRIEYVEDKSGRKSSTLHTKGSKVVEQTKKEYKDHDKNVKVEKTRILKED